MMDEMGGVLFSPSPFSVEFINGKQEGGAPLALGRASGSMFRVAGVNLFSSSAMPTHFAGLAPLAPMGGASHGRLWYGVLGHLWRLACLLCGWGEWKEGLGTGPRRGPSRLGYPGSLGGLPASRLSTPALSIRCVYTLPTTIHVKSQVKSAGHRVQTLQDRRQGGNRAEGILSHIRSVMIGHPLAIPEAPSTF